MSAFLILFFREYFWLIVIGVVVVLVGLGRIIRHRMRPKANGKLVAARPVAARPVAARPVAARNVRRNPDPEQMQDLTPFLRRARLQAIMAFLGLVLLLFIAFAGDN